MGGGPHPREAERVRLVSDVQRAIRRRYDSWDQVARIAQAIAGTEIGLMALMTATHQVDLAAEGQTANTTPRDMTFCSHAVAKAEAILVEDATKDPRFAKNPLVVEDPGIRFYAGVPLMIDGLPVGTVCAISRQPGQLSEKQMGLLKDLSGLASAGLELYRLVHASGSLLLTDPMTGIGNRPRFLAGLEAAALRRKEKGEPYSITLFDLDGFKAVNDRQGHAAGDQVLKDIGAALSLAARPEDVPCRLGGDEFAILFPGLKKDQAADQLERIKQALDAAMARAGWAVTFSMGLAEAREEEDIDALIATADRLMYDAKQAGKNRIVTG